MRWSPPMAEPLVELRGVWKSFGGTPALRDVSVRALPGRMLAVLGPNGAGKSTLLRVAAGITRPSAGEVRIAGASPNGAAQTRRAVGFAGHLSMLYGHLSAAENLAFYARLYGLAEPSVQAALERFGLDRDRHRPVRALSRGLVQRVSLARALLHAPQVVLLDEPFTGLDAEASRVLRDELTTMRAQRRTVLMATHAWEEALELADDAVVLVGGRVALSEAAATLGPHRLAAAYRTA